MLQWLKLKLLYGIFRMYGIFKIALQWICSSGQSLYAGGRAPSPRSTPCWAYSSTSHFVLYVMIIFSVVIFTYTHLLMADRRQFFRQWNVSVSRETVWIRQTIRIISARINQCLLYRKAPKYQEICIESLVGIGNPPTLV